jgi:anti-sigma B factor antagonist
LKRRKGSDVEFSVSARAVGSWTVLDVQGDLDLYTAPRLREELLNVLSHSSPRVAVNLLTVSFMDSTGLGVLVAALKRAREANDEFALVSAGGSPGKVIALTGLDRVFDLYKAVEDLPMAER